MARRYGSLLAALVIAASTLALSACNTVAGAGKDVSAVGHDVTRGSTAARDKADNATDASKD